MRRITKIFVTVLVIMVSCSCEYKEEMNIKEIYELVILMKEFVADDSNFINFYKHSVDRGVQYEEEAEEREGLTKYHYSSNEVDRFFESGIMYTNNKVSNKKTKTMFRVDEISFFNNIHSELANIKLFTKEEYINEITGSVFPTESYKTINIRINSDILLSDGLISQNYSRITIYASFDMNDSLENVGIIYKENEDKTTFYETGPKILWKIEFNEDFSKYD